MNINYWAVLVAAIASMVIGSIWYGPLFGKKFMHAMGMDAWSPEKKTAMKKRMGISYFIQFIASLVMFFVLSMFLGGLGLTSAAGGVLVAVWVWIGFVVPLKIGDAIWGGSMQLFWITSINMLITLAVAGAVIGAWR